MTADTRTKTPRPAQRPEKPPVNFRRMFSVRDQLLAKLGTDGYSRLLVQLRGRA